MQQSPIATALLQDNLKTYILLDGGYFLDPPPPGGDQADFAPRIKIPVLMVNGRYDYVFPLKRRRIRSSDARHTRSRQAARSALDTPHDVTECRPQLI